jgi:hypothetical protein
MKQAPMGELQEFVADLLEHQGAAVEQLPEERLEVLAPQPLREAMGWPELAQLRFGAHGPHDAIPIGLEGDWLDRFGALLDSNGRWAERQINMASGCDAPSNPERVVEHALELPNAVWRLQRVTPAIARFLVLTFRYTALSDEKRESLLWLGLNLSTGGVADEIIKRMRPMLAQDADWNEPDPNVRTAAGAQLDSKILEARVRKLVGQRLRVELEPFLRAARRRMERDRARVHAYHNGLWAAGTRRIAALNGADSEKARADREREQLRIAAIEREYHAKLDDLRHNYAMRVVVDWVQALQLYIPVHRFDLLIRRRKGERRILLDWHPLVRMMEPPPCDWGMGLERVRLVCDDKLHLTEPAGQAPCPSCAKAWCRACQPGRCPRCGHGPSRGN